MSQSARGAKPRDPWHVEASRENSKSDSSMKTRSMSPRPRRMRAVDAVKLAKRELDCCGPIVKAGRMRLAALDDRSTTGPVLHEGFYKLAAVTRPAPTLRQKAAALKKSFDMQLQGIRQLAPAGVQSKEPCEEPQVGEALAIEAGGCDTFITAHEEPSIENLQLARPRPQDALEEAELARRELELCVDTLKSYSRETSAESRERGTLLESTTATASTAIQNLMLIIERQAAEAAEAEKQKEELRGSVKGLEEDAEGLRRMVQHMLRDEAELQRQKDEKMAEVSEGKQSLAEAEAHAEDLREQLEAAQRQLRLQEELQRTAQEKLRDGSTSPMMAFSTFVLGPDQVPSASTKSISGEALKPKLESRTEKSMVSAPASTRNSVSTSGLHIPPGLPPRARASSQSWSRSATPELPEPRASSCPSDDKDPAGSETRTQKTQKRPQPEEESSDSDQEPRRPSPLAAQFPGLVPYLDLAKDAETDKIKAQTTKQNFEHIEKHMVLLQEERQKHMEQNKLLQQAVDATLERLLVWVQATFDSLRDFGPEAVQQDAKALEAVRDMLAWLAQRTCKAWIDPPATLEKALSSHEERLRAALAAPGRSEQTPKVEELRKELQQQRQRAEELEALLKEAEQREQKLLARRVLVESATPVPQEEVVEAAPAAMPSPKPQLPAPDEVQDPAVSDAPEQVEERREETCDAGAAAAAEAEQEAQRMRLFRCPFAEAIDLTLSRCGPEDEDKRLGRRQLRSFIGEVYTAKRLEDRRRDKAAQPRRALHCIMQEMLRRLHGVKSLVHRRSWQLLEAIAEHASSDTTVGLFADFLDGSRDLDELSFYLYCSALIASTPEETQVPSRLPLGIVSEPRCIRLLELLFDDLPKARTVVKEEIEKQVPRMNLAGDPWEEFSLFEEVRCIEADGLCRALLEGWRVCCLLLTKNLPHFSWRDTVLAFLQADVHGRGWLDPHEVQKAESRPRAPRPSTLPLTDQTTLGAFVFRTVQSLGGLNNPVDLKEEATELASCEPKREPEACLQLCLAAFHSLEPSLAVYLKWLLHSEEPRDRTVYQSVKARIFGVRRSASAGKVWPLMHNLRCLLILLLSHQFDMQLVREEAQPEHIGWEMTALLQVLRESWRRGASGQGVESGPEFGPELEEVGEANMREQCDSDQERPVSGRERPVGYSVSFK